MNHRSSNGFILPSVLLIGLGTLIIGLSLVQTSASIRASIDSIYYNKIATEAAEAGASYATYCLKSNSYQQTWGPSAYGGARPNLTQSTDCTGATLSDPLSSLTDPNDGQGVVSTFSVGNVSRGTDGSYIISSTSKIDLIASSTNTVIKSYSGSSLKAVGGDSIKYGLVTFGYYPSSSIAGVDGAFFAVPGSDGNYRVVGANQLGQLGNGTTNNTLSPEIYNTPGASPAVAAYSNFVSQGYNLFIRTADGKIYGAGLGNYGQLGNNSTTSTNSTPQQFILPPNDNNAVYVAPNGQNTFVLTSQGSLYAAGDCTQGELGNGSSASCTNVKVPTKVQFPPGIIPVLNSDSTSPIVLDNHSVYIIATNGQVWGWGNDNQGELVDGKTGSGAFSSIPHQIGTFGNNGQPTAKSLAFDGDTIYIIDSNNHLWAAGRNNFGEMATTHSNGAAQSYTSLQQIILPDGTSTFNQVATDQWTAIFLTTSGAVWGAGYNGTGELGNGTTSTYTDQAQQFILPPNVTGKYIYNAGTGTGSSYNDTLVVGSDGKVYGAGGNSYGQLGLGYNSSAVSTPQPMQIFDGVNITASQVITGLGTTIILSDKQIYYTVGNNKYGQLGNGTTSNTNVPSAAEYLKTIPAYIF